MKKTPTLKENKQLITYDYKWLVEHGYFNKKNLRNALDSFTAEKLMYKN